MAAAIGLRDGFTAAALRRLVQSRRDGGQVRRLLALAVIYDGGSRSEAARIGEDLYLVGHTVHLDKAPAGGIGDRVIIIADAHHAFAADPAIELEHGTERDQRQEEQGRLFLSKGLVDDTASGRVHAGVGDIAQPVLELAVEVVEITEAAAEGEVPAARPPGQAHSA